MKHIVFDCETLARDPFAVVLSIGAVAYDTEKHTSDEASYANLIQTGFHVKFNVQEQVKTYKRNVEDETLSWWKKQSKEAKAILHPSEHDVSMVDGLNQLNSWLKSVGYDFDNSYCWSRGTYFDFPMFYSMYNQAGISPGYNGWKIRDVRTMIDCLTGSNRGKYDPINSPVGFIAHDALHDAAMDAYRMLDIMKLMAE